MPTIEQILNNKKLKSNYTAKEIMRLELLSQIYEDNFLNMKEMDKKHLDYVAIEKELNVLCIAARKDLNIYIQDPNPGQNESWIQKLKRGDTL